MMQRVLCVLAFVGGVLTSSAPADIISYLRFEGTGTDETGLMNGELLNFDGNVDYEGWSSDVFAATVPQTGQPNTGSLRFAGGSEFVDLSNGHDLSLGTSFTIEFFMKPDAPVIGSPIFGFAPVSGLYLTLSTSGGGLYWSPQFQSQLDFVSADLVQTGVWQHVALVKTPGEYSIYVNGALDYSGSLPYGTDGPYFFPGSDTTGDRTIGGESGTFRGYLDEFRISDTALTPDQFLIVPEPSTLFLISLGLIGLCGRRLATKRAAGR